MTAYFPVGEVLVGSRHDTEHRDVHLLPYELESLSEGCHEEQEEDRRHVVSLTNSYTLGDLFNFIFDFQHTCVVAVNCFNGIYKFWWGSIPAQDVNQ